MCNVEQQDPHSDAIGRDIGEQPSLTFSRQTEARRGDMTSIRGLILVTGDRRVSRLPCSVETDGNVLTATTSLLTRSILLYIAGVEKIIAKAVRTRPSEVPDRSIDGTVYE